ncbi:hypothetical protein OIDMADRAFT_128525 [Oidiodendron maius Zn]|uniref:DUF676 domain-containing protein n=1 Tax=Oidiodendron maius (strain Zn) TaxID=913774 RepID=A0A0C3H4Q0_OIDMZ|nr:hypothetical protein OIDMADRAFT_128525 [Oidiodendron maius Zn]
MNFLTLVSRSKKRKERHETPASSGEASWAQRDEDSTPIQKGQNHGVRLLHQPSVPTNTLVDIVFVHGLTGNAYSTWYNEQHALHWPSKLLKDDIPEARIFTFGYDADVASFWGGASQNRLANHAENMLGDLAGEGEETVSKDDRSIIFVVHSLGGLVTEKALQLSENNAETHLRQIEACTIGILFLGTPHSGSGFAPFAKSVAQALKIAGKRVNTDILDALKQDSQTLLDVEDWFGHWLRRRSEKGKAVDITSLLEEKELPIVGKVVTEASTRIFGYPMYGINENHMNMTKFTSAKDPGYKTVTRELRRWIKKLQDQKGRDRAIH